MIILLILAALAALVWATLRVALLITDHRLHTQLRSDREDWL